MNLTHRFFVPAPLDDAWAAFGALDQIASCYPGATVTGIEDGVYGGYVKIKFGPFPLVYAGTAHYREIDTEARRMVVEARGRDRRGSGTAAATVTAHFVANGRTTEVVTETDLAITGRPAQFGQGVITDVSERLLDLFLNCVSERFAAGTFTTTPPDAAAEVPDITPAIETAHPADAAGPENQVPPATVPPSPPTSDLPPARPYAYRAPSDSSQPDFHVVSTIVPVLLKRGWPVLVAAPVVFAVVRAIVRRARRR